MNIGLVDIDGHNFPNLALMKNQIDIVKDIADGMIGIGGIPSNEEHYEAWGSPGSNTASMEGLTWTIKK